MIVKKDFVNKLKELGLNSYEAKLWTALLSRGVSSAGELSDIANVPRSRSYDVLESLEKKGFIVTKIGKPIKYLALPPSEVLDRVKKKMQEDAQEMTEHLDELKGSDTLEELGLLYKQGIDIVEPHEMSGAIRGRNNLYNHIESQIKNAKHSVYIMTSDEGLERKAKHLKKVLAKAKGSNIKIRIGAPLQKADMETLKELQKVADVRSVKDIDSRFVVVDGQNLTFMVSSDKDVHASYDTGIWVNTPHFAGSVAKMFDRVWEK